MTLTLPTEAYTVIRVVWANTPEADNDLTILTLNSNGDWYDAAGDGMAAADLLKDIIGFDVMAEPVARRELTRSEWNGWTVADWEKWSNDLAEMLPPEVDGDEDQETLIAQWVGAAATYGEQLQAVGEELDRWESEMHLTARGAEHLERLRDILEGERS